MKSIKPGRGPSRRGAAGALIQIVWGCIWTALVCGIMVPVAGPIGVLFALFGLCFIGIGVYNLMYHKRNAEAEPEDRDSLLEIVDTREDETDTPSDAAYCPWCGEKLGEDFQYCPKCGRKLP